MAAPPDPKTTLAAADRETWRDWLAANYRTAKEIWLVYPKKSSGKPRISYNDAVEEALAFGWIDSTVRPIDRDRYAQRFTPRKPGSPYSEANKERLRTLVREGRVAPDVLAELPDLGTPERVRVPPDIRAALRADPETWRNFRAFPPAYRRIRVGYVEGARDRPAEFAKRLRHLVAMTKKGRMFGFGGIDKHFGVRTNPS